MHGVRHGWPRPVGNLGPRGPGTQASEGGRNGLSFVAGAYDA